MNVILLVAGLLLVLAGVILKILWSLLGSRKSEREFSMDQCLDVTAERYRPMERLLAEADFQFLASQPGYSAALGRRLRRQRRRIFSAYLRSLQRDFSRICSAVNFLLIHAAEDRPELSGLLVRQRVRFAYGVMAVEGRLLLHALGVGTVDVRGLVESFEVMQAQVRMLLMPAEASAASS